MAMNATCNQYNQTIMDPAVAVVTLVPGASSTGPLPTSATKTGSAGSTASPTASGSGSSASATGAANTLAMSFGAVAAGGVAAFFL